MLTASREKRRRPRGYATWRPQAKTRALLADVAEILDEYHDHLPLTVRQIFYRLVARRDYPKVELAYSRLAEHLVRARRFWDATARRIKGYRRDRQDGQRQRIELWCEAAGMAPQLARVADEFSVPVFSAGGFASLSATRLIAQRALEQHVPTVLLHVGDLDPSGESIFAAMVSDAAAFVMADRRILPQRIEPVRVALTAAQVDEHQLPTTPPKRSDSRSAAWHGGTCQLEALPPDVLADIVRTSIRDRMQHDQVVRQIERERVDEAELWRGLPKAGS